MDVLRYPNSEAFGRDLDDILQAEVRRIIHAATQPRKLVDPVRYVHSQAPRALLNVSLELLFKRSPSDLTPSS